MNFTATLLLKNFVSVKCIMSEGQTLVVLAEE